MTDLLVHFDDPSQTLALELEEKAERSQAATRFESKEDFYRFLEQEVAIAPADPGSIGRLAPKVRPAWTPW